MSRPTKEFESRRNFVKRSAYVAPAIVTLRAVPTLASTGSQWTSASEEGLAGIRSDRRTASRRPTNASGHEDRQTVDDFTATRRTGQDSITSGTPPARDLKGTAAIGRTEELTISTHRPQRVR
jgi:hypothetical protein